MTEATAGAAVPFPVIEIKGEPTALYHLYDASDDLLYLGITNNLAARFAQHAADKYWWPQVARKTAVLYGSRQEAEIAEGNAIRSELPLHNIAKGKADPEARHTAVRKLSRQSQSSRGAFSLEPFIRAYAAKRGFTYADAVSNLIFSGIIKEYMDRFEDPAEAMAALETDMGSRGRGAA